MIKVSDIMDKEVINVKNGKKLGYIIDLDLDIYNGKINSFTIFNDEGRGFFSRGYDEEIIFWRDILKIGYDTIIVSMSSEINTDEFDKIYGKNNDNL